MPPTLDARSSARFLAQQTQKTQIRRPLRSPQLCQPSSPNQQAPSQPPHCPQLLCSAPKSVSANRLLVAQPWKTPQRPPPASKLAGTAAPNPQGWFSPADPSSPPAARTSSSPPPSASRCTAPEPRSVRLLHVETSAFRLPQKHIANPTRTGASPPLQTAVPRHAPSTSECPTHPDSFSASRPCSQIAAPVSQPHQIFPVAQPPQASASSSSPAPPQSADSLPAVHREVPASPHPTLAAFDTSPAVRTATHPRSSPSPSTLAKASRHPKPRTISQTWRSPDHRRAQLDRAPKSSAN